MEGLFIQENRLTYTVGALALVLFVSGLRLARRWKDAPPGPPTLPFLGNLYQIPKKNLHLQYQKWGQKYGPIYSLKLGSQNVVVLASGEMIKKVVDKRGVNYADRPALYMQEVWEGSRIILRGYDALWKVERKLYHQFLNTQNAARYTPYQDLETKQLCHDVLSKPEDFEDLITRSLLSISTSMTYGFRVTNTKSEVMRELLNNAHGFFAMVYQTKLLDWYPQLKTIMRVFPDWMNPIARKGKELFRRERAQFHQLYDQARVSSELDSTHLSFAADIHTAQKTWTNDINRKLLTDRAASYIAGVAMEAGADTASNTLAGLVKAMMLFPEVQRKAQSVIDSVVGGDRMPTIEDFDSLPYIRQVVKEALRWMPTSINGAVPHAAVSDDVVDGYKIPAGTTVILAIWSANNDPKLFPNPREFDPSRHDPSLSLGEAAAAADFRQRDNWTFGAGRRICPGIHVAERSLFLATVRLLWGFNIEHARGPDGNKIHVDRDEVTQSIAARPVSFPCKIEPRSERHAAIIEKAWMDAKRALDDDGRYKERVIS